jgi:hypothetical protein
MCIEERRGDGWLHSYRRRLVHRKARRSGGGSIFGGGGAIFGGGQGIPAHTVGANGGGGGGGYSSGSSGGSARGGGGGVEGPTSNGGGGFLGGSRQGGKRNSGGGEEEDMDLDQFQCPDSPTQSWLAENADLSPLQVLDNISLKTGRRNNPLVLFTPPPFHPCHPKYINSPVFDMSLMICSKFWSFRG